MPVDTKLNSMGLDQSPLRYVPVVRSFASLEGLGETSGGINPNFNMAGALGLPNTNSTQNSGGNWSGVLQNLVQTGFATTTQIMRERFGGPQPGQYFQNAQGTSYALPSGPSASFSTFPQSGNLNVSSWILPVALIGGLILLGKMR